MEHIDTFTDPDVQRCPFPLIKKMHRESPVLHDPVTGYYVVADYNDIAYVTGHPEIFSSQAPMINGVGAETPEILELYKTEAVPRIHTLVTNDPPSHTQYRAIVDKVFAPSYVKGLEPYIVELVDDLIDDFVEKGSADLLRDFCVRLPCYVIADQLGAPRSRWEDFKHWSDVQIAMINPQLSPEQRYALSLEHIQMHKFFAVKYDEYKNAPQTRTLLSRLAHTQIDDCDLSREAFHSIAETLLVAGNETTTGALGHAFVELIRQPQVRDDLVADNGKITAFVEEVLRMHAPSPYLYRIVVTDAVVHDVAIPKGSIVMLNYLGGDYDPAKFTDPDKLDLDRKGIRNHLAFGRGIHYCIGHQLARAELRIGVERVLSRLEDLRFDPDFPAPGFVQSFHVHAVDQLKVRFTPGRRQHDLVGATSHANG